MCCTFVYSVINLTWNKQYMFFIVVVSDLNGPRSVTKYDKKWIKSITDWQHTHTHIPFWKKRRSAKQTTWQATGTRICAFTVNASTTDRKIAEPESGMDNPVRTIEEGNTGRNDTQMKKVPKDKDKPRRSQLSKATSHLC
jgi:hypothetical protein